MNYINEIKKSIKVNEFKFNLEDKLSKVKVSKLGLGENNFNFLVEINNKKFVCRIT